MDVIEPLDWLAPAKFLLSGGAVLLEFVPRDPMGAEGLIVWLCLDWGVEVFRLGVELRNEATNVGPVRGHAKEYRN